MDVVWIILLVATIFLIILLALFFCLCSVDQKRHNQANNEKTEISSREVSVISAIETPEAATLQMVENPQQVTALQVVESKSNIPFNFKFAPNHAAFIFFSPKETPKKKFMNECQKSLRGYLSDTKVYGKSLFAKMTRAEYNKIIQDLFKQEDTPTLTDYKIALFHEASAAKRIIEIYATREKISKRYLKYTKAYRQLYEEINRKERPPKISDFATLCLIIQKYLEPQHKDS